MADDWAPGDLALCVDGDADWHDFRGPAQGPKLGEVNEVQHVKLLTHAIIYRDGTVYDGAMLGFAKWPGVAFWHGSFRKINPLTEDEEREARREIEQDKRITKPVEPLIPAHLWLMD